MKSIGIAVFTLNGKDCLERCLKPFIQSILKPKILVIDSSSTDGTQEEAKRLNVNLHVIPGKEFNHGLTREKARKLLNTDIVVMLTQDAYSEDPLILEKLVKPLIDDQANIAYARQLPHKGAGFFESFPRQFNYPPTSHIRSLKDLDLWGTYTYFCSDSCAAYLNKTLDSIGGFKNVLLGEDTFATAEILHKGGKIAYVAEAEVRHSHHYSLSQEFKRYFDTGLVRKQYKHLLKSPSSDQKRGNQFVKEMFKQLLKHNPRLIPYAILNTTAKFLGYKIGYLSFKAPVWWKKALSSQRFYWDSIYFRS